MLRRKKLSGSTEERSERGHVWEGVEGGLGGEWRLRKKIIVS